MANKTKKPAEQQLVKPQPTEPPQPGQQMADDGSGGEFSTSFAQTEPPPVQE